VSSTAKLLAAPAAHRIERSHAAPQRLHRAHEHLIARLESEPAVERLEVVDVHDAQRHRGVLALCARDLVAHLEVEVRPVVRARQRIDEHETLDA
jgi:hypothetical protein